MAIRLTLTGVGAMRSPRYAPAGLLLEREHVRLMFDGGPRSAPVGHLDAWLVTDEDAELIAEIIVAHIGRPTIRAIDARLAGPGDAVDGTAR